MVLRHIPRNIALVVNPDVMPDVTDTLAAAGIQLGDCVGARERARLYQPTIVADIPEPTRDEIMRRHRITPVQMQVLKYIAEGYTNAQIGLATGRTELTVKTQVGRLLRRLGANTRCEAVACGYRLRLLGGTS